MERVVKIGNVEMYESEVAKAYHENKYVVSYVGVFQLDYSSVNKMYYGRKILDLRGIAKRGRFHLLDAETINHILGKKVLVER